MRRNVLEAVAMDIRGRGEIGQARQREGGYRRTSKSDKRDESKNDSKTTRC